MTDSCSDVSRSVLVDKHSIADLVSCDDVEKCDTSTNTDTAKQIVTSSSVVRSAHNIINLVVVNRINALRRSKTFSPSANTEADYICKVRTVY